MTMRNYTRNGRSFPNDEAAMKVLYLAIREVSQRWKAIHHWQPALDEFQIIFGDEHVPLVAV